VNFCREFAAPRSGSIAGKISHLLQEHSQAMAAKLSF
jgi:hypothetical protein